MHKLIYAFRGTLLLSTLLAGWHNVTQADEPPSQPFAFDRQLGTVLPDEVWQIAVPLEGSLRGRKLRVYAGETLFRYNARVQLRYVTASGQKRSSPWVIFHRGQAAHDIPLADVDYRSAFLFVRGKLREPPTVERFEIIPLDPADKPVAVYSVAIWIVLTLLLPGLLLHVLFFRDSTSEKSLLLSLFPLTIAFYLVIFLVVVGLRTMGLHGLDEGALGIFGAFLLVVIALIGFTGKHRQVMRAFTAVRGPLIAFLAIVVLATYVVTHDTSVPFQNMHYRSISGPKTFWAFGAHDPWFQYANSRAIADHVPLTTHYAGRAYGPEDREILPAVITGVGSLMLRTVSPYVGESYLAYTIISTGCNVMLIFPLIVLARRYFHRTNPLLLIALFSANAYVFAYYYFTVFKLAGGALFLSGLAMLLCTRSVFSWAAGGAIMGLGTNMHGGVALGIPLFFLFLVFKGMRNPDHSWVSKVIGPFSFLATFTLINLPWKLYKGWALKDSFRIFQEHFLYGYGDSLHLIPSVQQFLERVPISEQLGHRLQTVVDTIGWGIQPDLARLFGHDTPAWMDAWNKIEFVHFPYLFLPPVVLIALACVWISLKHRVSLTTWYQARTGHLGEVLSVLMIGYLTLILISFSYYSTHQAWSGTFYPAGVIALVHFLLVGLAWQSPRFLRLAYGVFAGFTTLRMAKFL